MTVTDGIVIAATVLLAAADPVAADDVSVGPGQRVRILAPAVSNRPIVGQLVASDDGTLTVVPNERRWLSLGWPFPHAGAKTLRLPRESVTRFERRVRPSRKRLGATIGGLVGLAAGIVIVERGKPEGAVGQGGGIIGVVLAMPLALIGSAVAPGDRWAVEDPKSVHVGLGRTRDGGVRVGLSFSF